MKYYVGGGVLTFDMESVLLVHNQELLSLCSARRPVLVNISIKFHKDILNGFKVIERTRFCHRNCHLQSSRGHNSNKYPRVTVPVLCKSSNVG